MAGITGSNIESGLKTLAFLP